MALPLMPKATAVWLIDNTSLTFDQVADFCGLHPLEVKGIADGEVAIGIVGLDPIANGQLTHEEIERCVADPAARLKMEEGPVPVSRAKSKGARYTPVSKRQDRPDAIAWLVKFHPELADSQIQKLLGTTKATIASVRDRSHWNANNIKPHDPVSLGICSQIELDAAVAKADIRKRRKAGEKIVKTVPTATLIRQQAPAEVPEQPEESAGNDASIAPSSEPSAESVFGRR